MACGANLCVWSASEIEKACLSDRHGCKKNVGPSIFPCLLPRTCHKIDAVGGRTSVIWTSGCLRPGLFGTWPDVVLTLTYTDHHTIRRHGHPGYLFFKKKQLVGVCGGGGEEIPHTIVP